MQLSHKYLNRFKSADYKEYKSKKRRSDILIFFFAIITFILLCCSLTALLFTGVFFIFGKPNKKSDEECLVGILTFIFAYLVIPFSFYCVGIISKSYDKIARKSRLKGLQNFFDQNQINLVNQLWEYVKENGELEKLIRELKKSSEDESLKQDLINDFKTNHDFFFEATEIVGEYWKYWEIPENVNKTETFKERDKFRRMNLQDSYHNTLRRNHLVFNSASGLIKFTSNIHEIIERVRQDLKNEKNIQARKAQKSENPKVKSQPKLEKITEPAPIQQTFNFEKENKEPEKTDVSPQIRKPVSRSRIIKAGDTFWENLGKRRMEIGRLGELLVLNEEIERIIREEGKEHLQNLEHSSVVQGDGLGYDITSILEGEKIFIEVKTTTGTFDADLTFTKNEIEVMRKLGKKYFLYRVYEFNTKTNEGKLHVFKGCEEIESFFDFTPQTFTLRRKN